MACALMFWLMLATCAQFGPTISSARGAAPSSPDRLGIARKEYESAARTTGARHYVHPPSTLHLHYTPVVESRYFWIPRSQSTLSAFLLQEFVILQTNHSIVGGADSNLLYPPSYFMFPPTSSDLRVIVRPPGRLRDARQRRRGGGLSQAMYWYGMHACARCRERFASNVLAAWHAH